MSKQRMQSSQLQYDTLMARAREQEASGLYAAAVASAREAWAFVDDMMKYEQKYEGQTFTSAPCIDLVLRYSPLLLDVESLDALDELLYAKKSIDRIAADDLAMRLAQSRALLAAAHLLWRHLEAGPCRQDGLRRALGGEQELWRRIVDSWSAMGVVQRRPAPPSYEVRLATVMWQVARGRCLNCGVALAGPKRSLLKEGVCPACGQETWVVLEVEAEGSVPRG